MRQLRNARHGLRRPRERGNNLCHAVPGTKIIITVRPCRRQSCRDRRRRPPMQGGFQCTDAPNQGRASPQGDKRAHDQTLQGIVQNTTLNGPPFPRRQGHGWFLLQEEKRKRRMGGWMDLTTTTTRERPTVVWSMDRERNKQARERERKDTGFICSRTSEL